MRSLSAPMETLVMINRPGPEKMTTYKMANTRTAERVKGMSNPDNPPLANVCPTDIEAAMSR